MAYVPAHYRASTAAGYTGGYGGGTNKRTTRGSKKNTSSRYGSRQKHNNNNGRVRVKTSSGSSASRTRRARSSHSSSRGNGARLNKMHQLATRQNMKKSITIGQYHLGKSIGQGTFGKVKLGTHTLSSEKVAIKVLQKSKIKEVADVERVSREIAILKKVNHDQVIRLFEVIDTPQAIYLIMEFCEGGELFDYIVKHTRIKEPIAVRFFHQIIDGLDYLHQVNVIHRDLKPENLLMQRRPEGWHIKIVDFGLSNTNEGNKLLKTACGSPCYAAPEMIAGKKYHGPLADLWSVGVILFAMVCGYLPFEDNNTAQLYKKILRGSYKAPKFISSQVRDLIARILNTDPTKRYTTYDIRRHTWFGQGSRNGSNTIKKSKAIATATQSKAIQQTTTKAKNTTEGINGKENNVQQATRTTTNNNNNTTTKAAAVTTTKKKQESSDQIAKRNQILSNIDETVLRQMADLGFNSANVIDSLASGKHNQITTAYQLLVTRKKKIQAAKKKRQDDILHRQNIEKKAKEDKIQKAIEKSNENEKLQNEIQKRQDQLKMKLQHEQNVKKIVEQQQLQQVAGTSTIPKKENEVQKATSSPSRRPAPPTTKPPTQKKQQQPPPKQKVYAQRAGRKIVKTTTNNITTNNNSNKAQPPTTTRPAPPSSRPPPKNKQHAIIQQGISLQPIGQGQETTTSKPKPPPSKPPRLNSPTSNNNSKTRNSTINAKSAATAAIQDSVAHANPMKVFHGVFDPLHTSTKVPSALMQEMKRVLNMNRVPYTISNQYGYTCQTKECRWKLEICKLEDVEKVYVIRRQRLAGDTYNYEITSKRCMEQMRL